jgi:hypothetical protein
LNNNHILRVSIMKDEIDHDKIIQDILEIIQDLKLRRS